MRCYFADKNMLYFFFSTMWLAIGGAPADGSMPSTFVRASEAGAALDSNLSNGGGTDDTVVLQRILDRAKRGRGVHLIIDGPALIAGLDVYSNTTIECTAGGGFYFTANTPRAIIRNAHRSREAVVDKHITIRGCFINGNRKNQTMVGPVGSIFRAAQEPDGTFRAGLQFLGVHYITLEDLVLTDIYSWGSWVSNAKYIDIRAITIHRLFTPYPHTRDAREIRAWYDENGFHTSKWGANDDGLHFTGPVQYLTIDGAKLYTWDDAISLAANDWVDNLTIDNKLGPYVGQGPITDVTISNVIFMGSHHGIRLLSSSQRLDRIVIQNVTGTIRDRMAVISPFWISEAKGNFGSITFSNVNVHLENSPGWDELFPEWGIQKQLDEYYSAIAAGKPAGYDPGEELELPLFSLNGRIENLSLRQIVTKVSDRNRPVIRVGHDSAIQSMSIDMSIQDLDGQAIPLKLIGKIQHLNLSLDWRGQEPIQKVGGSIGELRWANRPAH